MEKPVYDIVLYDGDGTLAWQAVNRVATSDHNRIRELIKYADEMGYTVGMYCMPLRRHFVAKPKDIYEKNGGFYCS